MPKPKVPRIPANSADLGSVFICAVRYCLGRATYMPHLVIDFITPYVPHLENRTLSVLIRDIRDAKSYGMDCDKTAWTAFLKRLEEEAKNREMVL